MQKLILALAIAAAPVRRGVPRDNACRRDVNIHFAGRRPLDGLRVRVRPHVRHRGGRRQRRLRHRVRSRKRGGRHRLQRRGGAFNVGDDNADCGVKGHTVIVHKGCPAENPECTNGGDRIGCCVLA